MIKQIGQYVDSDYVATDYVEENLYQYINDDVSSLTITVNEATAWQKVPIVFKYKDYVTTDYVVDDYVKGINYLHITANSPITGRGIHLNSIDLTITANTPLLIQSIIVFATTIPLNIAVNDITKILYLTDTTLNITTNNQSLTLKYKPLVIPLNISTNQETISATINPNSLNLQLSFFSGRRNIAISHLGYAQANFSVNSIGYKSSYETLDENGTVIIKHISNELRALKLNGITFTYPLIYSKNFNVSDYISNSSVAIDGSSIVSVMKKAKFASNYELTGNFVHEDIVKSLFESITSDVILIEFTNGYAEKAKFNLLANSITAEPLYEGAKYYNLKIKVLV